MVPEVNRPTVPAVESSNEVEPDQEVFSSITDLHNDMDEVTTLPASHSDATDVHLSPIPAGNAKSDGLSAEPNVFGESSVSASESPAAIDFVASPVHDSTGATLASHIEAEVPQHDFAESVDS
ncbi:hypothetical protein V6N13_017593 [Hibiscus sabdariffa]|uniref:Uncharacterized protein n=2 Tax=Hibiscus sabdariffa TaxID=183260 RepID=A0ABR2AH94_9ROSI